METHEGLSHGLEQVGPSQPTERYRAYVLGVFLLVYTFNFVDRQIVAILVEPIKVELGLKDWQLGFLTGTAFAIFYSILGIPIARLADRWHRVNIMTISLCFWSVMTLICGLAANFVQFAAARIGVGVGEAGGSPPAISMIADYFPSEARATAMGIYSLGLTLGTLVAFGVGGWVNDIYGWRTAFVAVALPGVLLALLAKLTVREPIRGQSEVAADDVAIVTFWQTFRLLFEIRLYRLVTFAGTAAAVAVYGFMIWTPTFLIRKFGLSTAEAGTAMGLIAGLAGGAGTFLGGYVADSLAKRNLQWRMRVPAFTTLLFLPLLLAALSAPTISLTYTLLIPAYVVSLAYTGPTWAMLQSVTPLRMRAVAAAIFLFVLNLVGLGLGPQAVGVFSDLLTPIFGDVALGHAIGLSAIFSLIAAMLYYAASKAGERGVGQ